MPPITKSLDRLIATMSHLVSIVLLLFSSSAWAGQLEDAVAAYSRKDYTEAVKWYRLAAAQGFSDAQYSLAMMYAKGQGMPKEYIRAHIWFNIAGASGHADALKARDIVEEILTPQQTAQAQKLARDCQARYLKDCD